MTPPSPGPATAVAVEAVIFDYGLTLARFARPRAAIERAQLAIAERIAASGLGRPQVDRLREAVHDRVEADVAAHEASATLAEVDIVALERRAFADIGFDLGPDLLDDCSRLIQEAWLDGVSLYADVVPTLRLLREHGLRLGLCSNAAYRPASMHAQLAHLGLDALLDAAVFSAEVRWRKPSSLIFNAALDAVGTTAAATVFVGDRPREDVAGAQAAGMRAVLITRGGSAPSTGDGPEAADAVITSLRELPAVVGVASGSSGDGRRN